MTRQSIEGIVLGTAWFFFCKWWLTKLVGAMFGITEKRFPSRRRRRP